MKRVGQVQLNLPRATRSVSLRLEHVNNFHRRHPHVTVPWIDPAILPQVALQSILDRESRVDRSLGDCFLGHQLPWLPGAIQRYCLCPYLVYVYAPRVAVVDAGELDDQEAPGARGVVEEPAAVVIDGAHQGGHGRPVDVVLP